MMNNKPERVTKLLTVKSNEEKSKLAKLAYQKLVKFSKEKACHGQITDKDISNPVNTLFLLEEALKGNDSFVIADGGNQKEAILKTFERYINKKEYKELPFDIFVNDRYLRAVSKEDKSDKNTGVIFIYDIYDLKWCKSTFDNLKSNFSKGYVKHLWINFDPYQYVKEIKPLIEKDIHMFYTSDKRIVSEISENPNIEVVRYVLHDTKPKIGINHKKHKNCISLYEYYRDVKKRRIHNYDTDFEFILANNYTIIYKYAENSPTNVIKNTFEPFPEETEVQNTIQLGRYLDSIECNHVGFNVYNNHTLHLLDSRVIFSIVRAMMGLKSIFYCDKENERLVRFKIGYYISVRYPHYCHDSIWKNIIFESGADIKEIKDMIDE